MWAPHTSELSRHGVLPAMSTCVGQFMSGIRLDVGFHSGARKLDDPTKDLTS